MENMKSNGNRPEFYGLVKIGTKRENKEVGKIALWEQQTTNDRQPPYAGRIEIEGKRYYVVVWEQREPFERVEA
jgi:hypothetical protein